MEPKTSATYTLPLSAGRDKAATCMNMKHNLGTISAKGAVANLAYVGFPVASNHMTTVPEVFLVDTLMPASI